MAHGKKIIMSARFSPPALNNSPVTKKNSVREIATNVGFHNLLTVNPGELSEATHNGGNDWAGVTIQPSPHQPSYQTRRAWH
jgi:hypothetical protein